MDGSKQHPRSEYAQTMFKQYFEQLDREQNIDDLMRRAKEMGIPTAILKTKSEHDMEK